MKTKRFIALTALAVLAVSCGKDTVDDGRLHLFAEQMTQSSAAKVLFDPAHIDDAEWVAGEQIDINGSAYAIAGSAAAGYSVDGSAITGSTLYAIYPATVKDALGNDIVVTNGGNGGCAIDIRCLAVNVKAGGKHDVYFPMAARYTADSSGLMFRHLTGGLKLTLSSSTAHTVTRLVVTATQEGGSPAIYKDLKPSWASTQLPGVPGGEVGEENGDVNAQFISDMTFKMYTNGSAGVNIPASGSVTFCIPMLAKSLKSLTVTGYNGDTQVFQKTKTLANATNIERNKMYNIPAININ